MIIIDVEASGLGDESYPIEIAWGDRFNPLRHDSFLIRPPEEWVYWDDYAQSHIHHLSRDRLRREGLPIREAVERLDRNLAGVEVYSDCVSADRPWIVKLYGLLNREPTFRFRSVHSLLPPEKVADYINRFDSTHTEHRALPDVRKIIRTLNFYSPG
ncbi:hypothetical protein SAMN04487881_0045 [Marinobacter sp. es.048]|uniref:hypothetical protein n=1 Tax=Marinobacter sp. es.048 TaxID=1761795 RepID=UPI000B58F1BA|nr:hypothetical protein [Marinobacter sp. es.048]SNC59382.1 hypothetical protein SAMN04487881_0045 [Marinobacter sp. es.048]